MGSWCEMKSIKSLIVTSSLYKCIKSEGEGEEGEVEVKVNVCVRRNWPDAHTR